MAKSPKKPAAKKKHALDLTKTLNAIDAHDLGYFSRLKPEEQKGFASPVVLRMTSSASAPLSEWALIAANEKANLYHFDLYKHPELQYMLMASCGEGRTRHPWIPMAKKESGIGPKEEFLQRFYPMANADELKIVIQHLNQGNNLNEFLSRIGIQSDDIKAAKKIFAA